MPPQDYETGPGPIDRPGGSGALRAVGIVLVALGGAVVLVCAGGAYWLSQNESVRAGFDALVAARDAPGAEELRSAGCDEAMIMESAVFLDMAERFAEMFGEKLIEDEDRAGLEGIPSVFVVCSFNVSPGLDCDEVSRIYREAANPTEPFVAQVASAGNDDVCQEVFAADGESLGDLDSWGEPGDDATDSL
ncbi:MAG: hypothetical protein JRH01_22950 [Deltaproteobacteria bacterium]|nr:hypothetical protein [Deltaproteobacteria bacterium]MBW2393962.1 hypothetical protein [Deltaproteobacteria bacterium]